MEAALAQDDKTNAANKQFKKQRQADEGRRAMLDYESTATAMRAKTAKLRALRLARDAAEAEAAAAAPPAEPKKKKATKKK
jgi:hypothetical protein